MCSISSLHHYIPSFHHSIIPSQTIYTVKECLDYFDTHGLCELPLGVHNDSEDEPYHMPRVISLDPIPDSWEGLPIDPQMRSALTTSEVEVQRRIWELLQTEHSYLQILETIINVSAAVCRFVVQLRSIYCVHVV